MKRVNERRTDQTHIGNLTLINNKLNPALSNGPWRKKKQGLQEHSTLFLSETVLSKWGNTTFYRKRDTGTRQGISSYGLLNLVNRNMSNDLVDV